jgi:hypothetical protein
MNHPRALRRQPFRILQKRQRGNALVYTLLSLIILALISAVEFDRRRTDYKLTLGNAEATIFETLRNAANHAISENTPELQRGEAIHKIIDGVERSIPPGIDPGSGEVVWQLTIPKLVELGYLPKGWQAERSMLNNAPYDISFRRTPASCITTHVYTCDLEGMLILSAPIVDPGSGRVEGAIVGPIINKIGADSAVSLGTNPTLLSGYGNTWSALNPLPGTPAGVVAVRVGTKSSALAAFVRIGDNRDPNLVGDLTVAQDLNIGGNSTLTGNLTVNAGVTVNNGPFDVGHDAITGTPCTRIGATGIITLTCDGVLNTRTGNFSEGLNSGNLDLARTDPNTLMVRSGELFIRSATGAGLIRFTSAGDIETTGGMTAGNTVMAPGMRLNRPVVEGSACIPATLAILTDGGLGLCSTAGVYIAVLHQGGVGQPCTRPGSQAADSVTGAGLICHGTTWVPIHQLLSKFVLMQTITVRHSDYVDMPTCSNSTASAPLLFLLPSNDVSSIGGDITQSNFYRMGIVDTTSIRGINSIGDVSGGRWQTLLTDAQGISAPNSNAIAMTYCYYP